MSDDKTISPAFREGWEAEAPVSDCPYSRGKLQDEWKRGWWARIEHEVDVMCTVLDEGELNDGEKSEVQIT